jgi:ribosome biogenesis GTPase A
MIVNMRLWYPLRIFNVRYCFSHGETKKKFFKIEDGKKEIEPKVYPLQYPKHPLNDTSPIIPRSRPPRFLTPKYDIPMNEFISGDDAAKFKHHNNKWTSPENAYILKVGLIGPVNAGKSQLFGALSHHVSAVSPKASTTQEIITTAKSYQK